MPILINDLLPSFRQHHNPTFIKLLVFISKPLNQVPFGIIIIIEIFTIQGVFLKIGTKSNQMVQGQDYVVDVAKHPNQAPVIFAERPKICVALHCHDGIQHLFVLSIRAAFLQLHCLISLVIQCRLQN